MRVKLICFALPRRTPSDMHKIKGRRRPRLRGQRSLRDPNIGVKKNPISGDSAQTSVMCLCSTPMAKSVGDTKAVSAAYENSMPITAADILTNSFLAFFLKKLKDFIFNLSIQSYYTYCQKDTV